MLCTHECRVVTVYHCSGLDSYTIIQARPPKDGPKISNFCSLFHSRWFNHGYTVSQLKVEDVWFAGYATTFGITEIHELKLNKIDFKSVVKIKGKPGRKCKVGCGTTWEWGQMANVVSRQNQQVFVGGLRRSPVFWICKSLVSCCLKQKQ